MCEVDWMAVAAWIGSLATAGLLVVAIMGLTTWRTQFIKRRDHDLAVRLVNAITQRYVVFDELRTPTALFSDSDVPVPPPEVIGPDEWEQHRIHFARYKARSMHLLAAREASSAPLMEAVAVFDDEDYATKLGELVNELATYENEVLTEARKFVANFRPNIEAEQVEDVDLGILFSPADAHAEDAFGAQYEQQRERILKHLRRKLRMT